MLSREDYLKYLKQMIDVENKMKLIYRDLEEKVSDQPLKAVFSKLLNEETGHANTVGLLVDLIKKECPIRDNG